jgi:integral membrane sensor domain MASE1
MLFSRLASCLALFVAAPCAAQGLSTIEESPTAAEITREPGFKGWIKYLWQEGLARKFIITHEEKNVIHLPLLIVILAALVAPWLVAIGIVIAVVVNRSQRRERFFTLQTIDRAPRVLHAVPLLDAPEDASDPDEPDPDAPPRC